MKFDLLVKLKLRTCFLAVTCFLSFSAIQAQTKSVKGVVSADGEPMIGATIIVKGTSTGTQTDFDGNYTIKVKTGGVLVFKYIGFLSKEIVVGKSSTINVSLVEDTTNLDEIIVIGYGTQKKKEVTGAVVQVSNEAISKIGTADLGAALQGLIAGVNVTASSGAPGADSNILIRGLSSVTGNSSPLYVVDGIPFASDPKLSMSEIETIDVLKDAASASIYGTRGSGGVILITTKKGKVGQMKISANQYYGLQSITSGVPTVNVEESLYIRFLAAASQPNGTTYGNTWTPIEYDRYSLTNETYLQPKIENDYAPVQNYGLSISGGSKGLTYNVVGSFFSQDGTIINSGYDRANIRANTQFEKGNWKISTGLGFRIEEQSYAPWNIITTALKYQPYQSDIDPNADIIDNAGPGNSVETQNLSNTAALFKQTDKRNGERLDGSINAVYKISDHFNFTTRAGVSYNNDTRVRINPLFTAYDEDGNVIPQQTRSGVYNQSIRATSQTLENVIDYSQSFGDHNVKAVVAYSSEKYTYSTFAAQKFDLISNDVTVLNGATLDPSATSGTGWGQDRTNSLIGMIGRLQYNYKGKYLFSASIRRDGSSRFSKANRWGTFPSVTAGWNVSDENWFEPVKDIVSSLKFRAGLGTTGNQSFLDYSNAATIKLANDYVFGTEGDDNLALGATQEAFANKNVKWETSEQLNLGFDLSFLRNSFKLTGDFYQTNKKDMLMPLLLPPTTGASGGTNETVVLNVGDMENTGYEFALNYSHRGVESGFNWNLGGTFSQNTNVVSKMSGSNKIAFLPGSQVVLGVPNEDLVSVLAEGYEAGAFFVIKTDGIIRTEEELIEYQTIQPTARLGDLRYIDYNNDNTISNADRQYAGSGTPEFEIGLNMSFDYKGFDFYMQWYSAQGGEIINGTKAYAYKHGTHKDLVYQWTPQNPTSNIPTNRGRDHENYRGYTDFWIQDGSFIRLRTVNIGYTVPNEYFGDLNITKFRVFLAAQNPLTITEYDGYDPEVGNSNFSSRGIDKGNYPISSQFRIGIQLDF
ncbi:SusC/RagA family TonB-linked outer membrane protein [Polaribacter sp. SA4-12]|uniref:SusC/RagA family TonB-linked outer membrane protein n=1 Tax=Polaribacter sp. SA4-12 TaxID=1312072 RepID=UPI000B3D1391|nr:TonB-dependent receptor [Polaribacter sp. SA4-12]ARV16607.1 SusC/RagA family TonB-linked outer membrane protein [Polaribacter sp. SA4-12]